MNALLKIRRSLTEVLMEKNDSRIMFWKCFRLGKHPKHSISTVYHLRQDSHVLPAIAFAYCGIHRDVRNVSVGIVGSYDRVCARCIALFLLEEQNKNKE